MEEIAPKCTCRAVLGFHNKAVGMNPAGCQVHDLTFAEMERKLASATFKDMGKLSFDAKFVAPPTLRLT